MADQNTITTAAPGSAESHAAYREYFAQLRGSSAPPVYPRTEMYPGEPYPMVVWVKNKVGDLESIEVAKNTLFEEARKVWVERAPTQMWVFSHLGAPPWFVQKG